MDLSTLQDKFKEILFKNLLLRLSFHKNEVVVNLFYNENTEKVDHIQVQMKSNDIAHIVKGLPTKFQGYPVKYEATTQLTQLIHYSLRYVNVATKERTETRFYNKEMEIYEEITC